MFKQKNIPESIQTKILITCRKRCCLCFGINNDSTVKKGQITHLDHNAKNIAYNNLVYLCDDHHSQYNSYNSQIKNLIIKEVKNFRDSLYKKNQKET